jgi:hypothetical protein
LAAVFSNGKWGYLNKRGEIAIKPQFAEAGDFCDGTALVNVGGKYSRMAWPIEGGKWFWIDRSGARTNANGYEERRYYHEGLKAVKVGTWGFIDEHGKSAFPAAFDWVGDFSEGLAAVDSDGKWGFIDPHGLFVIPAQFERASKFSDGLAAVGLFGKYGFINRKGGWVIQPGFAEVGDISGGFAPFIADDEFREGFELWGIMDKSGNTIVPPRFTICDGFSDGIAPVMITQDMSYTQQNDVLWGFIDGSGEFAIDPVFQWATPFSEGLAAVRVGDPSDIHPLIRAIYIGRAKEIQDALTRVKNINDPIVREPPLILAVLIGQKEAVRLLLAAGADVNKAMQTGPKPLTPLELAKSRGDKEIIEMLQAATTGSAPASTAH